MGPKEHEEEVLRRVKIGNDLTVAQRLKVESLIRANHEAFAIDLSELNACTHTEHHLDITPGSKLTRTAFGKPMSDIQLKAAVKLVDKMIDAGIIEAV
ncbi:hypothetical protein HD553DRAFT_276567, partial [Filobasidium floriforme]|uniref:uncharacterized protein n=1 Tax=Filobasidium floriforme TaxID=5210 RepID=UPI001E8CAAD6